MSYDKRTRARQDTRIEILDYRGPRDLGLLQQHTLDFNRRNPLSARLEAIIAAAHVKPEPVAITTIKIARSHPAVHKGACGLLRVLPITNRGAVALDRKITLAFVNDGLAEVSNKRFLVTFKHLAAPAVTHVVFMVGHEHVQHLGRTDRIQHLHAKSRLPLFTEMRRQCFTGRDAKEQARAIEPFF